MEQKSEIEEPKKCNWCNQNMDLHYFGEDGLMCPSSSIHARTDANMTGTGPEIDPQLTQENLVPFFEIPTSRGPILVDESDRAVVEPFSWYATGGKSRPYAHARVPRTGERISMHRVLMGSPIGLVVHHRNNNSLDNRRANLEITTNRKNIKYAFEGKQTGVHFDKKTGRYRVAIRASLGTYFDEATARVVAAHLHKVLEAELEDIEALIRYQEE